MGVPPGISFIFLKPNSRFSTVSGPFSHVVKTWDYPDLRGKIWPKNFHEHLQGQIEWQLMAFFIDNALSCAVSQGIREGEKSHALSSKPTLYKQGLHSASTPVYVSGSIDQRRLQWAVFYGTSTGQIHHTLSWHLKKRLPQCDQRLGMKFDTKYSCKMSQVATVTQSIVSADGLLARRQNNVLPLSITWERDKKYNISLRRKKCFQCWNKTGDRMVKQVGEVLTFSNVMSPARRVAR